MIIKSRLREILEQRGISQRELGRELGLSVTTIFRLVNDKFARMEKDAIAKVMVYLNLTSFDDLFYIDGLTNNQDKVIPIVPENDVGTDFIINPVVPTIYEINIANNIKTIKFEPAPEGIILKFTR